MKKLLIHFALLTGATACELGAYAQSPDPLTFTGTVGTAQTQNNMVDRNAPSMLVLTLLDSSGGRIKFCNGARYPWNLAIASTNAQAAAIQQTVTQAQSANSNVTVVASEDTTDSSGFYCGIKSLTAS